MSITGADQLIFQLRNRAQKVPENARKVMHRESDNIVKLAQIMVPEDDGEAKDSIHVEKGYEGNGRLKIDIVAGGVVRGVNVDRYIMIIHENYEQFKPGPVTEAKRAANPGIYIGSKFIERAIDARMPKLQKAMIASVIADMEELEG